MAKKRANGEGNIRKRKDGRWGRTAHSRRRSGDGETNRKERPRADESRMQRKAPESDGRTRKDRCDEAAGLHGRRVGAALVRELRKACPSRESTAAYYKNYIDQHIVPRIGDIKLAALTTLQIQKFYNETKAHGRVQRVRKHGRSESQQ